MGTHLSPHDLEPFPWLKFMLYPPVFSSLTIWKLSVLSPNGFSKPLPRSFSFPHISAVSLSWASLTRGGSSLSWDLTVLASAGVSDPDGSFSSSR